MLPVLTTIYSLPFLIGSMMGFVLHRLYCYQKVRWQDRNHPLPEGEHRRISRISRIWIAGLVLVMTLGYVLLTVAKTEQHTAQNEQHTAQLNEDVKRCWAESYLQAKAQILLNQQNDLVTRALQAVQRDYDRATSDWLKDLVNPPGDLANQDTQSPSRKAWGLQRTAIYQAKLNDLGKQVDDLNNQRVRLDQERAAHPLTEPLCGK